MASYKVRHIRCFWRVIIGILILPFSVAASDAPPAPFKAIYKMQWQSGMTLSGEATRQLLVNEHNMMTLLMHVDVLAASIAERSQLKFTDGKVNPSQYNYQRRAFFRTKKLAIEIDQDKKQAVINQQRIIDFDHTGPILDSLSMQLQLQLDVKQADLTGNLSQSFPYLLATDNTTATIYEFTYAGDESITVPLGKFNTIKVKRTDGNSSEREVYIWFAPDLNYQILRILQKESDGEVFELSLKAISNTAPANKI